MDRNEQLRQRLLVTFQEEAREHIQTMSARLVDLERARTREEQAPALEIIFREAHSLKGAARAVGAGVVESVCQALEGVFAAWKRAEIEASQGLFDLLHRAVDTLSRQLAGAASDGGVEDLIHGLESAGHGGPVAGPIAHRPTRMAPAEAASEPAPRGFETIRIAASRIDRILLEVEELLSAKLTWAQRVSDLQEIRSNLGTWRKTRRRLRSNGDRKTSELFEEDKRLFSLVESRVAALSRAAERDQRALGAMVDQLLDDIKKVVMLPASSILETVPKIARDLARDRAKSVVVVVEGAEIEMDRRILDGIRDPLVHLVRNCIDHGIERPEVRERAGKPAAGTLRIALTRQGSDKVEISVADDGAGVQADRVREAAVRLSLLTPEESHALGDREVSALIFQSGLSTSPIITDLSGRGLGLAIVREKIEQIGGAVSFETRAGAGTTFRMVLPLTRATLRGILVRVGDRLFVLPTAQVERVLRVRRDDIKTVENRETISFGAKALPFVSLGDVLAVKGTATQGKTAVPVIVLGAAERQIAFGVDEVLQEQEVLAKPLGKPLVRIRNIAGATVLGNGRIVPVLDAGDLLKSAAQTAGARIPLVSESEAETRKSILVAEDSITSRALIRNILESAGYRVQTAPDGAEALLALKTGGFHLVVSDVEMPRLDGFDLTAKIRADKKLSATPVVLVTGLESREHRERGIDVGANAYLVKSSFDQSNLLEIVRRLI